MHTVSGPPEIDAALFGINKQEGNITFVSGAESKAPLKPENLETLITSTYAKNKTKLFIYSSKASAFAKDLEYFAKAIQDNLEENNFELATSEKEATLILRLQTSSADQTTIHYSSQNSFETKPLSQNILAVLPSELQQRSTTQLKTQTTQQASIDITLGMPAQQFLETDGNKRYVGRYIALAINQYYLDDS